MKITREVITDLLPLYLAGEASKDTQELINEFLQTDPDLQSWWRHKMHHLKNLISIYQRKMK